MMLHRSLLIVDLAFSVYIKYIVGTSSHKHSLILLRYREHTAKAKLHRLTFKELFGLKIKLLKMLLLLKSRNP